MYFLLATEHASIFGLRRLGVSTGLFVHVIWLLVIEGLMRQVVRVDILETSGSILVGFGFIVGKELKSCIYLF